MKKYKSSSTLILNSNHKNSIRKLNKNRLKIDGEKERKDYGKYREAQEVLKSFKSYKDIKSDIKWKEVEERRREIYKSVVVASSYEQIAESEGTSYPPPEDAQKFITEEAIKNLILSFLEYIATSVLMDEAFYKQLGYEKESKILQFWGDIFLELEDRGYIDEEFIDFFIKKWNPLYRNNKIILFTILNDLVHHSGHILRDFLGFLYDDELRKYLNDLEQIF